MYLFRERERERVIRRLGRPDGAVGNGPEKRASFSDVVFVQEWQTVYTRLVSNCAPTWSSRCCVYRLSFLIRQIIRQEGD